MSGLGVVALWVVSLLPDPSAPAALPELSLALPALPELSTLSAGALYAVLFALVFAESGLLFGFFLPGDTVLFAAGLLAADPQRGLSLPVLAAGVLVCAVAGDLLAYTTGRRAGRPLLLRREGRMLPARALARAERFYDRFGVLAVISARFIPWLRTFTPILAGIARMDYRKFLLADIVGAVVWGPGLLTVGYVAYSVSWLRYAAYAVAGVVVLASMIAPVVRRRRRASAH